MFSSASLSGDYTLDINPVSLEDDARFQCQVGAADEGRVAPIRSRYAETDHSDHSIRDL